MGLAIYGLSYLFSAFRVDDYLSAILFVLILTLLNMIVRPILVVLTIPVTVITLGLFLLIINAIIIVIADTFMDSVSIKNFWWAILLSLLISIANSFVDLILNSSEED